MSTDSTVHDPSVMRVNRGVLHFPPYFERGGYELESK
jgi:hypothetical protein